MLTTCVPTFPASSTKSIENVITPAGSLARTALDCNCQSIEAPGGLLGLKFTLEASFPSIVTLDVCVFIFSLPEILIEIILPSPALEASELSERMTTEVKVGALLS